MADDDYYKILSIQPFASHGEIKEAAKRLSTMWNRMRIQSEVTPEKHYQMASQIRRATLVLTDPVQRLNYDVERGYKKNFRGQTKQNANTDPIPLKFSESIEALTTIKIPGQLDYDKLEKSINAMKSSSPTKLTLEKELLKRLDSRFDYSKPRYSLNGKIESKRHRENLKHPVKGGSENTYLTKGTLSPETIDEIKASFPELLQTSKNNELSHSEIPKSKYHQNSKESGGTSLEVSSQRESKGIAESLKNFEKEISQEKSKEFISQNNESELSEQQIKEKSRSKSQNLKQISDKDDILDRKTTESSAGDITDILSPEIEVESSSRLAKAPSSLEKCQQIDEAGKIAGADSNPRDTDFPSGLYAIKLESDTNYDKIAYESLLKKERRQKLKEYPTEVSPKVSSFQDHSLAQISKQPEGRSSEILEGLKKKEIRSEVHVSRPSEEHGSKTRLTNEVDERLSKKPTTATREEQESSNFVPEKIVFPPEYSNDRYKVKSYSDLENTEQLKDMRVVPGKRGYSLANGTHYREETAFDMKKAASENNLSRKVPHFKTSSNDQFKSADFERLKLSTSAEESTSAKTGYFSDVKEIDRKGIKDSLVLGQNPIQKQDSVKDYMHLSKKAIDGGTLKSKESVGADLELKEIRSLDENKLLKSTKNSVTNITDEGGISEVFIKNNLEEPVYFIDEENLKLSPAKTDKGLLATEKESDAFDSKTMSPTIIRTVERSFEHTLYKKHSDNVKKLSTVRSFTTNSSIELTYLKDEPISSNENEFLKNRSRALNFGKYKSRSEEREYNLFQSQKSEENKTLLEKESLTATKGKGSKIQNYDIKHADSLQIIKNTWSNGKIEPNTLVHQIEKFRSASLPLVNQERIMHYPGIQNNITLQEEVKESYVKYIPSGEISEHLKEDIPALSSKDKLEVRLSDTPLQLHSKESESKILKVMTSLIDYFKKRISATDFENSLDDSYHKKSEPKDDSTENVTVDSSLDLRDRIDSKLRITQEGSLVNLATDTSSKEKTKCFEIKPQESRENQMPPKKKSFTIPKERNSENLKYEIKDVDSFELIKNTWANGKVEQNTFVHPIEEFRSPILSLENKKRIMHSPGLNNTIALLEEAKENSVDDIQSGEISEHLKENIPALSSDDKSKVKYSDTKKVYMPLEEKIMTQPVELQSKESESKILRELMSLIDYFEEKISVNDFERYLDNSYDTKSESKDDSTENVTVDSSLDLRDRIDSKLKITREEDLENLSTDTSSKEKTKYFEIKSAESKENLMIPRKKSLTIPENKYFENLKHEIKHVDSFELIKNAWSGGKIEPNIFLHQIEKFQSPSLSLENEKRTMHSPGLQDIITLQEEVKESSVKDIPPGGISEHLKENIPAISSKDKSQVRYSDTKEVYMPVEDKVIKQPIQLHSAESETMLLKVITSLVDYFKQNISVNDFECSLDDSYHKKSEPKDESTENVTEDSSLDLRDRIDSKLKIPPEEGLVNLATDILCKEKTKCFEVKSQESSENQMKPKKISHTSPEEKYSQNPECEIKRRGVTEPSTVQHQDEKYSTGSLPQHLEGRKSFSPKLQNAMKLLEEIEKMPDDKDIPARTSEGIEENIPRSSFNDKPEVKHSDMNPIFMPEEDKILSEGSDSRILEKTASLITNFKPSISAHDRERLLEEYLRDESRLASKSQNDTTEDYKPESSLGHKNKTDSIPEIHVDFQRKMGTTGDKFYSPDISIVKDDKESVKSLDDTHLKQYISNGLKEETDASEFVTDFLDNSTMDKEIDAFTKEKLPTAEKKVFKVWRRSLTRRSSMASQEEVDEAEPGTQNVSVTTQIAGVDIKSVYHFGPDTEFIEIFLDGHLKAKIVKDQEQDIYSNAMKHDDFAVGVDICASTVISANGCIITTEVIRRGKRESIAVYKNDRLLCRSGNTILD